MLRLLFGFGWGNLLLGQTLLWLIWLRQRWNRLSFVDEFLWLLLGLNCLNWLFQSDLFSLLLLFLFEDFSFPPFLNFCDWVIQLDNMIEINLQLWFFCNLFFFNLFHFWYCHWFNVFDLFLFNFDILISHNWWGFFFSHFYIEKFNIFKFFIAWLLIIILFYETSFYKVDLISPFSIDSIKRGNLGMPYEQRFLINLVIRLSWRFSETLRRILYNE